MSENSPPYKRIENEMARRYQELTALREQLDSVDKNNVWEQSRLQIEIAIKARELDSIERLYKILRGEK